MAAAAHGGAAVRRQKFFKFLLPGSFEFTLRLPPRFAARFGCPAGAGAATLCDHAGRSWDVQLIVAAFPRVGGGNYQTAPCFTGTGWCSFVSANRLAAGDLLVFDHRGGLDFAVDTFVISAADFTTGAAADDMESGNRRRKPRGGAAGCRDKNNCSKRKHTSPPSPTAGATSGSCRQEEDETTMTPATAAAALQLHRNIAKPYQLRCLDLSKGFCDRVGWTSSRTAELTLMTSGGNGKEMMIDSDRRWPVSVKVSDKGGMICGGWMEFVKDNRVSLSDTCVFHPGAGSNSSLIRVQLLS